MSDRNADVRRVAIRRHIEDGRRRIVLIRNLIAQVASRGGDTTLGESLLATMEGALETLVEIGRANCGDARPLNTEPMLRLAATIEAHRNGLTDGSAHHQRDQWPVSEASRSLQPVRTHLWNRRGRVTLAAFSNRRRTSAS